MVVLQYDPILSGAICHNDLTCKMDITKNLGADKCEYNAEAMTLLMQAMIHRIYEPGCKYEIMICLFGGQGAGTLKNLNLAYEKELSVMKKTIDRLSM